ncbi:TRAP transporter substrate-binding protein DctP [Alsobacter soli]|uniref:TRAP transporter substrate-binding protein DctP n=1 Tax=Alsobacter soli TaxID=2109933 RepID=A0A2T1HY71_9HYPH|nr:sialic acid TRAP transporter substrate-binding protein SiaP [Alsobacter soli]PSC06636.1 TRAP transporter substrate-binding protein DctP [Alsobacter soli]
MTGFTRRTVVAGLAAGVFMPAVGARAQSATIRWGESLAANHPQVLMAERIAKDVKDKSGGRLEIQVFPNAQLGTGKEMMDSVSAGVLQMTTEGAGAVSVFLPPLSVFEAPYLWRDAAHLAKAQGSPLFARMNEDLAAKRGMRLLAVTYYGKRHLTTGSKPVQKPADVAGLKLRVPPVDVFRAMVEAWGAQATPIAFPELYLALSQGAVDGQENPLPTIQSGKFYEVQKHLILTQHVITPRLPIVNEAFWKGLPAADRDLIKAAMDAAVAWQNQELLNQEAALVGQLKTAGMSVVEPDVELWRKPVLDVVPKRFEERWGKGTFDALANL